MTEHFRKIRRAALDHHKTVVKGFHGAHKHAKRLFKKHKVVIHKVREHSLRTAAVGAVSTGLLAAPTLMTHGAQPAEAHGPAPDVQREMIPGLEQKGNADRLLHVSPLGPDISEANQKAMFKDRISRVAPGSGHNLTADEEQAVTQVIQETFGITARAELDGIRLNHQRGIIAGEQHLPLYPGDSLSNHFKNRITGKVADPTANLTGMVPGLPSWGYFAKDAASVTKKDVDREQWYIAAQTFLAPGWQENTQHMYKWFKYRKMILVNQKTGQAVVACIGDAGPSPSTKRSFGGSNEVLIALGLGKIRTAEVMVLFVDDPNDTIPLGPLTGYDL